MTLENFNEQEWLERWGTIFNRFQNECKARKLSNDEMLRYFEVLLRKEEI